MGTRKHPRVKMVLPVRIAGSDADGKPFSLLSHTLDFSRHGARLGGVQPSLKCGDEITVDFKRNRGRFKVRWVDATRKQVGVENLEPEKFAFLELPAESYVDDANQNELRVREDEANAASPSATAAATVPPSVHGGKGGKPLEVMPSAGKTPPVRLARSADLDDLKSKLQKFNDDTDGALQLIADSARELVSATGVAVAFSAGDYWICRAASGVAPRVGVQFHTPQGLTGEAVSSGRVTICLDTESDPRVNPAIWRSVQLRSVVSVPVLNNGHAVGVLEVFADTPYAFGVEHVALLKQLAALLAGLVVNAL